MVVRELFRMQEPGFYGNGIFKSRAKVGHIINVFRGYIKNNESYMR